MPEFDATIRLSNRKTFQCQAAPENTVSTCDEGMFIEEVIVRFFFLLFLSPFLFSCFTDDRVGFLLGTKRARPLMNNSFVRQDRVSAHIDERYNSRRITN